MTRAAQPGPLFTAGGYAAEDLVAARLGDEHQQAGARVAMPRAGTQARWIVDALAQLGPRTREELLGLAPWRLHLTEAKLCARIWALEGNTGKGRPAFLPPAPLVRKVGKKPSRASGGHVEVWIYDLTPAARRALQEKRP